MFAAYRRIQQRRAIEGSDSGFTLIELLIVIVVLGILAAIVVFSLGTITGKSAVAACEADAQQLNTGLAAYYAATQSYPAQATVPASPTANTGAGFGATGTGTYPVGLAPKYLQTLPDNPTHYTFTYTAVTTNSVVTGFSLTVTGAGSGATPALVAGTGTTTTPVGATAGCAATATGVQ